MRVSLSKRACYHADIYCSDSNTAKKILKKHYISLLAVDFYLNGRENGRAVLEWAKTKHLLPRYIVVTESDRTKRAALAEQLIAGGYLTADETTFIRQ